jgi:FlaA1/EpsC-like NDP-sugar epimerase
MGSAGGDSVAAPQPAEVTRPGISSLVARTAARVPVGLPLAVLDVFLVAASYTTVLVARFDGSVPSRWWDRFVPFIVVACTVHVGTTALCGGYRPWWRHASIDEARRIVLAGVVSAVVLLSLFAWNPTRVPLSLLVGGPVLAVALMGGVRFQSRLFGFRRSQDAPRGLRVVVVGAGKTGAAVLREMRQNPRLGFLPVAVVDDDPSLHRRSLHGVRIVGGIDRLSDLIHDDDVHLVLLAIQSGDPAVARRVADGTNGSGVPVRLVREASYWVHGAPLQYLRALSIEDLLGRQQVEIDLEPVERLLHGARVLVTGGGGWIGAEIARQVREFEPAALALLDHDETHLYDTVQEVDNAEMLLVDVRDQTVVEDAFRSFRPDIVFHAAAHKHVPILEQHACEAVRTNVLGTANVVEAAERAGVERFVLISTDKAAQPTNVMGASKWLAEQVVLAAAPPEAAYCSVRFGNVLGSRGSVIPTFQHQIDEGGPVTVTDPAMTRFFMSVTEAVRLVLYAAASVVGPSVLALEMGEQVKIGELAERMVRLSGYRAGHDIEIQVVGPRPGENVSEAIIGPAEQAVRHDGAPFVSIAPVRLSPAAVQSTVQQLGTLASARNDAGARSVLLEVAARVARARPA